MCSPRLKDAWGKVAKDEGDQDYFFRFVLDDIEKFTAKSSDQTQPSPGTAPQASPAQTAQP